MRRVVLALSIPALLSSARADDDADELRQKFADFNESYVAYWETLREFNACMARRATQSDAALETDNVNERRNAVLALTVCERPQVPALIAGATYRMPRDAEKQAELELEYYAREVKEYQLTFTVGGTEPVDPRVENKRITIVDCTEVTEDLVQIPKGPAVPIKSVVRELNVNSTDLGCAEKRAAEAAQKARDEELAAAYPQERTGALAGHITLGGELGVGSGYHGGLRIRVAGAYRLTDSGLDVGVGGSLLVGGTKVGEDEAEMSYEMASLGPELQIGQRSKEVGPVHNRIYLSYSPQFVFFNGQRELSHRLAIGVSWISSVVNYEPKPDYSGSGSDDGVFLQILAYLFPANIELVVDHLDETRIGAMFAWGF